MLVALLTKMVVLGFGAIQGLLTLRLVMGFLDLPRAIMQFEPTVIVLSEPLIDPFRGFQGLLGGGLGGLGGMPGGGFTGGLDSAVLVALVGWSLVELVVLGVLRIFRGRDGANA
ncbi:MAG: YggT family protein [Chloroflexota bacterium]|nr:YggT family protein [Chloroflexota bacterium]